MRTKILAAALAAATALSACNTAHEFPDHRAGAGVRFDVVEASGQGAVGSGVYIGNGVIITAAHVLTDDEGNFVKSFKIRSDAGDVQGGEILWANRAYDIAAVRPHNSARFHEAHLDCRSPHVGEAISAFGNPLGVDSITMHGYVSGDVRAAEPKWKSVFITDMTTIGGMSGGPTYDAAGNVIGITVGTFGFGTPEGGLGFVVPSSTVCKLLGRA